MQAEALDIDAALAAWRHSGADRRDPLRFHHIAALRRRAAAHDGVVRQALDARLVELLGAWADAASAGDLPPRGNTPSIARRAQGLGALADDIATRKVSGAALRAAGDAAQSPQAHVHAETPPVPVPPATSYPELPALQEFRQLWSQLRTGSQVRRSLAQVPDDAGPLHSSRLVHRSLTLMHGLSPAYLQHFLAYADTLSWLDALQAAGVLEGNAPTPIADGLPRTRAKPKPRTRKA